MTMACINALAFCVAHRDFHDENILVRELSKVKDQISQGLQYFASKQPTSNKPAQLKDQVQRFLSKLSTFLDLSEDRCFDILVHYLASYTNNNGGFDEDQVQKFIADGHISDLLNRIRLFYWQERLSLLGLLRIALCNWHESWFSVADVLFAMTSYASRMELLNNMLKEYIDAASSTESLLADGRYGPMRLIQPTGFSDLELQDEFDVTVSQRLKEQLEMLNIIFTGVHALCDSATPPSCFFSKLLEAFWSKSFGLQPAYIQSLAKKHRYLVERMCLMQTLILIRAANLDNLSLFTNVEPKPEPDSTSSFRSTNRTSKRSSSGKPTDVSTTNAAAHESSGHFLHDARLLNRLLASLSGLGDAPVHGPLLLFGAVCATAFVSPSVSVTAQQPPLDCAGDDDDPSYWGDRKVAKDELTAVSETSYLVAGQYAQTAIEALHVFGFLAEQLANLGKPVSATGVDRTTGENSSTVHDATLTQTDSDLGIIEFCAHVAVFDLLSLMAQHVVLWSLDNYTGSRAGPSNRAAFIHLFARTLRVVAYHSQLAARFQSDASSVIDSPAIGQRIAGLIESLAEGFPLDLSLLHLCTALMVSNATHHNSPIVDSEGGGGASGSLVSLVSDLIIALPYLTEAITPELKRVIQHASVPWYPQFGRGDGQLPVASNEIALTQMRTLMAVTDCRQRSSGDRQRSSAVPTKLFAGVRLPTGTRGKIEPDLGWVVWKHEYSVWVVAMYEVHKALALLNQLQSYTGATQWAHTGETNMYGDALNMTATTTGVDESYVTLYRALFNQLTRVLEFARLLAACVEAQVHVSTCLYLMEDMWLLILRCLSQTVSNKAAEFSHTKANDLLSCSIPDMLFDQLIPCILRLLANAFSGMSSLGDVDLLIEHTSLWNLVLLPESHRFFPRLILSRTVNQFKSRFSLTASHLSSQLSSPTMETSRFSASSPLKNRQSLLLSYLEFLFGLLTAVKWMCSFSRSWLSNQSTAAESVDSWIYHGAELLKAGLMVTVDGVIAVTLKSDRWALASTAALRADEDQWLLLLAEQSFVLLTDLLTTHVSQSEIRLASTSLDDSLSNTTAVTATVSNSPRLANSAQPQLLASLQSLALRLLLDNPDALHGLLTFSSIPFHSLVAQFKAFDHGLSIGDQSVNTNTASLRRLSLTRNISNVVWFGLTLVHHVLGLEHVLFSQTDQSTGQKLPPLLSCLMTYNDPVTREHYVAVLFTYLRYPYNVGLPRGAVTVLKWLTQNSPVAIVDYLSPESCSAVRDCVLHRLASAGEDHLTRVALFDLIAETVLACPVGKRTTSTQFLLRFLTPTGRALRPYVAGQNSTTTSPDQPDCLDCCVTVLNEAKIASNESGVPDQLMLLLLTSVTKLIAALYLQEYSAYINVLKSKPNFWNLLTAPMFQLLGADTKRQAEYSNIEYEYCGHVASILGLELSSSLNSFGSTKPSDSVLPVLNRLANEDIYFSWFRLVADTLNRLESMPSPDAECLQPVLNSLYEALCRWKCLLMVHLDFLTEEIADRTTPGVTLTPVKSSRVVGQLVECLRQLTPYFHVSASTDLANQLAVCLNIILNHYTVNAHVQSAGDLPTSTSAAWIDQLALLVDFLMTVRPGVNEQARHLHADLLASCNFMWLHEVKSSPSAETSASCQKLKDSDSHSRLHTDLLDCAFGYTAQLAVYADLSTADEAALRQAINLLLQLWDDELCSQLGERLIEAGVLNNLLVTLQQHSQSRTSAALCHDIVAVVMRILCSTQCFNIREPDGSDSCRLSSNAAQLVSSYGDLLAQAFCWPAKDVLLQWIREDELVTNYCVHADLDYRPVASGSTWIQLLVSELHCLCVLHDNLGGLNQPFVARLIDRFCTQNSTQLEAVFRHWCEVLYEPECRQRILARLPLTTTIMHEGLLPPIRLELARAVGALYWRLLVAGESLNASALVSGSGMPTIGTSVLYRKEQSGRSFQSPYFPSYGPNTSAQFSTHLWHLAEWQVHCCCVLLRRFDLKLAVAKSSSSGSGNPVTTATTTSSSTSNSGTPLATPTKTFSMHPRSVASPRRPHTPTSKSVEACNPLLLSGTTAGEPSYCCPDACSGQFELACLVRHLVICLDLLVTQMPLLGSMALFTSEELQELRPCVQLVFNSPSLEDSSPQLTFGVLISLAHALSCLYLKVSRHTRHDSSTVKSENELSSLLVQAHEMTLAIMLSQASLILIHGQTSPAEKQLLVRELTSELKSCNLLGRSSRRRHSLGGHRASHSPSSRSSSTARAFQRNASPVPGGSIAAAAAADLQSIGTRLTCTTDLSSFGFEHAMDRFAELLRLSM